MFYTKYRPQKFSELEQPNDVGAALMNQVRTGKTVHAYLFTGPRGTGKTTTARILAKALNCEHLSAEGDVCGECSFCLGVQNQTALDLVEIDAASNRGIDDIRELKDRVKLAPSSGKKKVYIIDEVHMLTNEAFNALLKTLEEPPSHVVFILCTTELHKVPETIKSRCQLFKFKRAPKKQIVNKLQKIARTEEIQIEETVLESIAISASGGYRDAETLLQQVLEGGLNFDNQSNALISAIELTELLILKSDAGTVFNYVNQVYESGVDFYIFTGNVAKVFRDLLYISMGFEQSYFDFSVEHFERLSALSKKTDTSFLTEGLEQFSEAQNKVKYYALPQVAVELVCVKLLGSSGGLSGVSKGVAVGPKPSSEPIKSKEPVHTENKRVEVGEGSGTVERSEAQEISVEIDKVKEFWPEVIKDVSKQNSSIGSLLKLCRFLSVEGRKLVFEVDYKFHKDRLETGKNRAMVEESLDKLSGAQRLSIACVVSERPVQKAGSGRSYEPSSLTDMNVKVPQDAEIFAGKDVLDIFNGSAPMQ